MGNLFYIVMLLGSVFISCIAQVMLKKAAMREHSSWLKEYLDPYVIFAYALFFGTTFLSIEAYKGIPLSMGPVLQTTSYIYITLFGVKIFGERLNGKRLMALALIIGGILVYTFLG